jgi:phage tail-like protein
MPLNEQSKIGLGNRFMVTINPGGWNLGSWAKADGLDVSWEVPEYRVGDGWNSRWFAPANTKYSAVKLTRAADAKDSPTVRKWLEKNATEHDLGAEATVELHDSSGAKVIDWHLKNVCVKKWAITSMDAGSSTVAIETLELEHEGFLQDDKKLG